jgi:outer membrane protein assembly factor BamB
MTRLVPAFAALAFLVAPAAIADWPAFHNDALGAGFVSSSSYPVYQDVWWSNKTLNNAPVHASPVIKDGILIAADDGCPSNTAVPCPTTSPANAGLVRALDVESGHELWHYYMAAPIEGTPAVAGETVYVVDTAGNLKALNLRNGACELGCTTPVSVGPTFASIREHQGVLFIGNEAGEMRAYEESHLTLLWTFSMSSIYTVYTPGACSGTPPSCGQPTCTVPLTTASAYIRDAAAIIDGLVIFGSYNHYVVAVDEHGNNGAVWIYKTGDIITGSPSVITGSPNHVVVGSYDGSVYDFTTTASTATQTCSQGVSVPPINNPVWTYQVPNVVNPSTGQTQVSKVQSSPANSGDRVFVGANNGHVYALDAVAGTKMWEQAGVGNSIKPVTSSPAVANGIVVVGSEDKNVYWLSAANGTILKSFATQAAVSTSPAIDGDRAIIAATDGTTYMFGPKVPPRADLIVSSVTATAVTVTATVKNQGTDPAPATKVRLFLGGAFLADLDVPALAAGASATVTYTGNIPPGTQTIKATVDPENLVKESSKSNNDFTLTVSIAAPGPAPTAAVSTTKKKSPEAGILFAGLLLVCAAAGRRRR